MLAKSAHLKPNTLSRDVERVSLRDGFGLGLVEAGERDERVMALCADLSESTRSGKFREKFPDRFVQTGVAEQNMISVAVGLSLQGKIPFAVSFAVFNPGRNWDQIRVSVCYNQANVKIVGAHAGLSVGPDGGTHQALEDMAITRVLPRLMVIAPADAEETRKAVLAAAEWNGPVYLRFPRSAAPNFTTAKTPFRLGRAAVFREGADVAIIAAGPSVHAALVAADRLIERGISVRVINSPCIKPLDEELIVKAARECGAVVTAEEHQAAGGLGGAIAELLATRRPVPMEIVAMPDRFGESGEAEQLLHKYRMDADAIVSAVQRAVKRK